MFLYCLVCLSFLLSQKFIGITECPSLRKSLYWTQKKIKKLVYFPAMITHSFNWHFEVNENLFSDNEGHEGQKV